MGKKTASGVREAASHQTPGTSSAIATQPKLLGVLPLSLHLTTLLVRSIQFAVIGGALMLAFSLRMTPLHEYGMVIHEFDPWFNYRAARYMLNHGWSAFFNWYDEMSWYPIGRAVGTTTYPGLQITTVFVFRAIKWFAGKGVVTFNELCCLAPCVGGVVATAVVAMISREVSQSWTVAAVAAVVMATLPSHMMRSMGGGFDNECLAIPAMMIIFYCWIRSVRTPWSWPWGICAGVAYGYMAAAWGGFVFVTNMVALHAGLCVVLDICRNRYNHSLHFSFSLYFVVGTAIAVHVPPIGWTPFTSLEQLPAFFMFIGLQLLAVSEVMRRRAGVEVLSKENITIKVHLATAAVVLVLVGLTVAWTAGLVEPFSPRIRGLFVQHTRTGNPLVDSVAEHQPTNTDAFWMFLHCPYICWGIACFIYPLYKNRAYAAAFLILYCVLSYYFSLRMARLILLSALGASVGTGVCVGVAIEWSVRQFVWSTKDTEEEKLAAAGKKADGTLVKANGGLTRSIHLLLLKLKGARSARQAAAAVVIATILWAAGTSYLPHTLRLSETMTNPHHTFKAQFNDGSIHIVKDYWEAYQWLKKNTPSDSRVLAWWDYGYQITGIANRTSLADGNTRSQEHIAVVAKCLISPPDEAHSYIQHLADYVLIWAGQRQDDLSKSYHMVRIGNSVFPEVCGRDPTCSSWGNMDGGKPQSSLAQSLLYHLHADGTVPSITAHQPYFESVFSSKFGLARIYKVLRVDQESKAWVADRANRVCASGQWFCEGQYPPAAEIQNLLKRKRSKP